MLSETELKVLAGFFPMTNDITIKELERKSGYSYERVYSSLKNLIQYNAVKKKRVGKVLTFSLIPHNDLSLLAFIYHSISVRLDFSKAYKNVWQALQELAENESITCLVLFGSYAKGDASSKSDVDVLCVTGSKIEDFALSLRHKYGLRINAVEVKSIKAIEKDNKVFYDELVEHGCIIKGLEYFFKDIYR